MRRWLIGALAALCVSPAVAFEYKTKDSLKFHEYKVDSLTVRVVDIESLNDEGEVCAKKKDQASRIECIKSIIKMASKYGKIDSFFALIQSNEGINKQKRKALLDEVREDADDLNWHSRVFIDGFASPID